MSATDEALSDLRGEGKLAGKRKRGNRNIGRDQISPQKKGGKADPVVKRRLSAGSKP